MCVCVCVVCVGNRWIACLNPRFTSDFVRKFRFCVLMKAQINLPKSFFVNNVRASSIFHWVKII